MKRKLFYSGSRSLNYTVVFLTLVLAVLGVIFVYSASCYNAERMYGNSMFFVTKQIIGVILGCFAMVFFYFFDYKILKKIWIPAIVIGFLVLCIVFVPGIGIESYGARRWINLGAFSFQASEVAKFCFIIFSASYISKYSEKMTTFRGSLPVLFAGCIMCLLIILEPNMSITICLGVLMITMLLVGGMKLKHLLLLFIPAILFIPLLIIFEPYRLQRLIAFLDPWANPQGEGFQLIQSLYSLGSGGWFGVGLFNSRQKYAFLPFSESDFIFSIIGEEIGFLGAFCVILCFVLLVLQGFKIAIHSKDRFGCLLAVGISTILAVQVVLNLGVVSGSIPPTGLPLPFISAGSTSLVVFMSAIGVVLNINKQSKSRV